MQPLLIGTTAILAYIFSRLAEQRVHNRNYQALRAAGAEELIPQLMRRYYLLPHLVLLAAAIEQWLLRQPVWPEMVILGGLASLVGLGLRAWSIHSLGNFWSKRCLALAGQRPSNRGPYRVLDNPEYYSRLIEVLGLCMLLGARWTTLAYLAISVVLNRRIVAVERRQLLEVACAARGW